MIDLKKFLISAILLAVLTGLLSQQSSQNLKTDLASSTVRQSFSKWVAQFARLYNSPQVMHR